MNQRKFQIQNLTIEYLDGMMPGSKVTYVDLVAWLYKRSGHPSPRAIRTWAREIVESRMDITIQRGRGICKRA